MTVKTVTNAMFKSKMIIGLSVTALAFAMLGTIGPYVSVVLVGILIPVIAKRAPAPPAPPTLRHQRRQWSRPLAPAMVYNSVVAAQAARRVREELAAQIDWAA
jgi:hypothetical protein